MADAQVAALPFTMGARVSERASFTLPNLALGATVLTPPGTPVQIPAVGYLRAIRLEVTGVLTAGGAATYNADAPWNAIASVAFKNSAGENLIAPLTGYELFIYNKYGNMGAGLAGGVGPTGDPKFGRQYSATTTGFHFFLSIPFEIDAEQALGAIPALASNRSYQLEISFGAITTIFGGTVPTAVALTVDGTAIYWDAPNGTTPGGVVQQTEPFGLGTLALVQKETSSPMSAGEVVTRINNVGNVIRQLIFIKRNSAGVRTDADLSSILELLYDNNPMLRLKKTEWEDAISRWYNYGASAKDVVNGLDTGVYVLPFDLLLGSLAGDPANTRAQLLATLDATLLQLKSYSNGTAGDVITTIVQSLAADNSAYIFSK